MAQLCLHTLGGLTLSIAGEKTTGVVTQRRRLGLLALLAGSRRTGLSRDRILGYLWPETSAERARHGLNQLLSAQRRAFGGDPLFLGNKTLRLNPEVITADVWDFEDACERGAHEEAVRVYLGPFLDGFFLSGAPEFERWMQGERERLGQLCGTALGVLAAESGARSDIRSAISWLRRAAELDPYDSETTIRLVEALIAAGDRSAAVRQAEQHGALLRAELGLAPDPRITRLIETLRGERGA